MSKRAISRQPSAVSQRGDKRLRIEDQIQIAVIETAILYAPQCPALRRLYAVPNGGKRPKGEAGRFKAMGGRAGIPDLHLPVGRCHGIEDHLHDALGQYHSLYIEMKKPGGKLSPEQITEIAALQKSGNCVQVCDSIDKAWAVLCWYLSPQWSDAGRAFREVVGLRLRLLSRSYRHVWENSSCWFEGQTEEEAADFLRFVSGKPSARESPALKTDQPIKYSPIGLFTAICRELGAQAKDQRGPKYKLLASREISHAVLDAANLLIVRLNPPVPEEKPHG